MTDEEDEIFSRALDKLQNENAELKQKVKSLEHRIDQLNREIRGHKSLTRLLHY